MTDQALRSRQVVRWRVSRLFVERLLDEAAGVVFTRTTGSAFGVRRATGTVTSPFDLAMAAGGAVANEVATLPEAHAAIAKLVPADLQCVSAAYLLYDTGCFVGVHTDRAGSDVNLLVLLAGAPTRFEFFPELVDEPVELVYERARAVPDGLIDGSNTVELPEEGTAVGFVGSRLPHQRRRVHEPLLALSLGYRRRGEAEGEAGAGVTAPQATAAPDPSA